MYAGGQSLLRPRRSRPERKLPEDLQIAVARLLKNGKPKQVFLKKSLGTKDLRQANITIKPVLIQFDRIIRDAEAA
jgi:hypothetical protein